MNKKDSEKQNRELFCSLMEESLKNGKIFSTDDMYVLQCDGYTVEMNKFTGRYLNTTAGKHKGNRRAYVCIEGFMCPDYTFKIVADGLLNQSLHEKYLLFRDGRQEWRMYTPEEQKAWCKESGTKLARGERMYGPITTIYVINHIDGRTDNNTTENLELVTPGMNAAHSRLMAEIYVYHPELVEREYNPADDCWMYHFTGKAINCKMIEEYNRENTNKPICAFKDKKGAWRIRFTQCEIDRMLEYFNMI